MPHHKCPHCPRKYNSGPAMLAHQLEAHPEADASAKKLKGWATPHGFVDFKEPVTYEEACLVSATFAKVFAKVFAERKK